MVSLSPTLGHASVRTGGRRAPLYDCGKHGKLTCRQIAGRTGLSMSAIQRRLKVGWRGEELLLPIHGRERDRITASPRRDTLSIAMKLARAFPSGVPTVAEIMAARPMTKDTAVRWRRAMAMEAGRIAA